MWTTVPSFQDSREGATATQRNGFPQRQRMRLAWAAGSVGSATALAAYMLHLSAKTWPARAAKWAALAGLNWMPKPMPTEAASLEAARSCSSLAHLSVYLSATSTALRLLSSV